MGGSNLKVEVPGAVVRIGLAAAGVALVDQIVRVTRMVGTRTYIAYSNSVTVAILLSDLSQAWHEAFKEDVGDA